jgi:uncharacterized SAM-binding protein YcdF (DUF218 family)
VTLVVITILAAVAIGLGWLKLRRTAYLLVALVLVLYFGVGCGPLAGLLADRLQAGYTANAVIRQAPATAIVLLGGGTELVTEGPGPTAEIGPLAYGRVVKSLQVYRDCKRVNTVCLLLITGGDPEHHGATEASVYGAMLRQLGVDPADLLLEEHSLNTFQNAQNTAPLLQSHRVDQVFLVTSGMHLRRSLLYFGHFGVTAQPVRADHVSSTVAVLPLSYNFLVMDLALHEYAGVVRYYVYQLMGWNVRVKRPGSL